MVMGESHGMGRSELKIETQLQRQGCQQVDTP